MAKDSTRKPRSSPLRVLSDWLRRPAPPSAPEAVADPAHQGIPERIGHYTITRKLGQGGMGVVYEARDDRLGRTVAIKTMSSVGGDETARRRFWREARAAASINHPNVCQLYEIGEERGELFIAMELLEGESLAERMARGSMNLPETLPIGFGILSALAALHAREVVHRDLKPSNVFLTPHGVKLLDFGLARTGDPDATRSFRAEADLTGTGVVMGTPRYMAPEQATGGSIDGRSDLFAAGAILFEMLAGRPAFSGRNVIEILHAVLHEQPPALTGSPAVTAVDRVLRRALAKRASERPPSAEAMADELRAAAGTPGADAPALAHPMTRLVVLPFRVLRPDPETDFLAFSLPDAIATSLSGLGSLIVRSSAAAARFADGSPDLKALAVEADVDRVVMGSVLRSGDQLQVTVQLVEAPIGTLLTSHTLLSSLGDLFRLQDDIANRVVEALALPLSGGPPSTPDAPRDARAYALYLQANDLARDYDRLPQARDLYRASLDLDPTFAPAWAALGRSLRVIGKYIQADGDGEASAEQAFQRAIELNPRLSLAHKYYANLEADHGNPRGAIVRLLRQAERHGNDPDLFAGLVHACRYGGLLAQSIAAHREARRLDPNIPTSVEQTLQLTGDLDQLLAMRHPSGHGTGDEVIRAIGLGLAGRCDEARQALLGMERAGRLEAFRTWADFLLAWLDRRTEDMRTIRTKLGDLGVMNDPEAMFQEAWMFCDAGDHRHGMHKLRHAIAKGYTVVPTMERSPAFDALRGDPGFQALLAEAVAGREATLAAFRDAGGERLLGL